MRGSLRFWKKWWSLVGKRGELRGEREREEEGGEEEEEEKGGEMK